MFIDRGYSLFLFSLSPFPADGRPFFKFVDRIQVGFVGVDVARRTIINVLSQDEIVWSYPSSGIHYFLDAKWNAGVNMKSNIVKGSNITPVRLDILYILTGEILFSTVTASVNALSLAYTIISFGAVWQLT